jgi:hypothetical protein
MTKIIKNMPLENYRESNLSLDRQARNLFAHTSPLLPTKLPLSHPVPVGISIELLV